MKQKFLLKLLLLFLVIACFSCDSDDDTSGCTDAKALNTDFSADEDDGSCNYSRVAFYASASFFNGIAIDRVDVSVNGTNLGSTNGTFYPTGPGNCSAPGTIPFQFSNGSSADWNATVYLINGASLFTTGTITPSSVSECLRVNMTN